MKENTESVEKSNQKLLLPVDARIEERNDTKLLYRSKH